jgi:hypothetical protein
LRAQPHCDAAGSQARQQWRERCSFDQARRAALIFALFAFGYVFGFVGLLLAVPLAAACRVLLHFALEQYYASPLYAAPPNVAQPVVVALAETKPSIKKPDDASLRRGVFLGVVPPPRHADPDHDEDR